jgi:hypothetical protein
MVLSPHRVGSRLRLRVGAKFFLAVGVLVLAVLTIAGVGAVSLARMAQRTTLFYDRSFAISQHAADVVAAADAIHETALYQVAVHDPRLRAQLNAELDQLLIPPRPGGDQRPPRRLRRAAGAAAVGRPDRGRSPVLPAAPRHQRRRRQRPAGDRRRQHRPGPPCRRHPGAHRRHRCGTAGRGGDSRGPDQASVRRHLPLHPAAAGPQRRRRAAARPGDRGGADP